jgi:hypothetical protein
LQDAADLTQRISTKNRGILTAKWRYFTKVEVRQTGRRFHPRPGCKPFESGGATVTCHKGYPKLSIFLGVMKALGIKLTPHAA